MVSAAGDFVYPKFCEINVINWTFLLIATIKCDDSVSFSFLSPCVFFQIASFQLKQIIVFLN